MKNHQMLSKAEDLRDEYYLIKMIPRPKAPKKKPVETPKEPQAQENLDLGDEEEKPKSQEKEEEVPEENEVQPEPKEEQPEESKEESADGDKKEDGSK